MNSCVYWLHLSDHTNIFTQGYIGVTKEIYKRLYEHKRLIKNNKHENKHLSSAFKKYDKEIIEDVLVIGSEEYCYDIEKKLRPNVKTGWNIAEGGFSPPANLGVSKKPFTEEHKRNISLAQMGRVNSIESNKKRSDTLKGRKITWGDKISKAKRK